MMGRGSVARGYPAAAAETVALAKALNIGGAYAVTAGAAMNELVGGLKAQEVGSAKVEVKAAGAVVLEGSSISEN